MDSKRRKLIATGLTALGALFTVNAKAETGKCKKVKVLTRDGKLVEIPECKLKNSKARVEEEEVRTWVNKKK